MMHEYIGSIHLHTTASDGTANLEEVAHLASQAGLDFIIATDHNILVTGKDGWYGDLLLLVGEEIHDIERVPEANHYLAFNIKGEVAQHAKDAQAVIDAVNAQGGFGFLAHPFEHSTPFSGEPEINWVDWQARGYAGLEIWNYMSEFKAYLPNLPQAFFLAYFPGVAIQGPFPETLRKWDELLRERRMAAIGGTDVHATVHTLGPLKRAIHSYQHCFRTVRTHILSSQPFNGKLEHDSNLVYQALKTGHAFVAYDLIGDSRGFRFIARSGNKEAIMGEEIALEGEAELEVVSPLPALLRLVHRGKVVAQKRGQTLRYRAKEKGAYRVGAYRRYLLRRRGWVFTNPIYVI
ncbi:MAG: CehA/McbA family metallohydrolase [Anaerolineae bacterium]